MTEFVEDIKKDGAITVHDPISKKNLASSIDDQMDEYVSKFLDMSNEAKSNDHKERNMSLGEGLRTFPKAVMWSIILSSALVMEGYDTNLLNSMYGFDAFNKKFGDFYPSLGTYQIPAKWQTALSMGYQSASIIGLFVSGIIASRIGYRKTLMTALITSVGLIFIQFFAPNREVLLLAYVLLGINWGAYQTLAVTYASEVAPTTLRVYLTTYVNVCWVFGQLISSGVLKGVTQMKSDNAYRIPFAIQWIWPIPLCLGVFLAPESPWYLAKKGRDEEAKQSLKRLLTENKHLPDKDVLAQAMLTKIQLTIKEEEATSAKATFKDCFTGTDFRRTRLAAITWLWQNITGSAFMGYSTYFYIQAGLSTDNSFTFSIVQYVLGIAGTVGSWFLSQKVGRFPIYFGGLCGQFIILIIVGALGAANPSGGSWGIGSLLLVYTFVYDLTVGPMTYCIVSELPSTRLRINTVMLARNLYNLAGIVVAIISPYMLNPTAWNWKAKTGFFWAGFCLIAIVWSWFELPETKDRTYAELDHLFRLKIKARDFKNTEVDVFDAGKLMEKFGEDGIRKFVEEKKREEAVLDDEKA
ncbi:maltose permease [Suhomyces tanzawaensis NRRL Y-17324]|uniref:Maltose permease n=1 Tax=Suhomyces tanzawaensis NRRL Y-17324 TaxID=984487 RepID=A0A1E4SIV6_9ASCO|nr:maltose permease [Suhomyces tanzawaensis NRRL Y-17324]ODV79439.1 maltose permease [Suhomyces tanzawaensis NRRL Y-17324]